MINRSLFSSASDNWSTPVDVYKTLNAEFGFDFDPCPLKDKPEFDGLSVEWGSVNFVNPPYSEIAKWCEKAFEESKKGKIVVLLIPSRTDTKYWHKYIMKASEIRFIEGRLKFGGSKNSAPFPSVIVIFNHDKSDKQPPTVEKIVHPVGALMALPLGERPARDYGKLGVWNHIGNLVTGENLWKKVVE